jgi:hypothetical protein
MIDAILTQTLLPDISREFLNRLMQGAPVRQIHVLAGSDGSFVYQFNGEQAGIRSASKLKLAPEEPTPSAPAEASSTQPASAEPPAPEPAPAEPSAS